MYELKTKPNDAEVLTFLDSIEHAKRREDSLKLLDWMQEVTKYEPKMWGDSIIGFGSYHYKYQSGHEGDWLLTGFSPRKQNLTIYIMNGFDQYDELLEKLGKFKKSKSCLYVNKLEDIDLPVLKKLIKQSMKDMAKIYKINEPNCLII